MSKFKAIDDGLEALDIPGYGCLIRTEKGRPLQVLEGVTVGTTIVDPGDETKPPLLEYTLIFDDSISPAAAAAAKSLKPTQVASSLASVNVNAFLKHVEQRSLSPAGEFGNYGPPIAKLLAKALVDTKSFNRPCGTGSLSADSKYTNPSSAITGEAGCGPGFSIW